MSKQTTVTRLAEFASGARTRSQVAGSSRPAPTSGTGAGAFQAGLYYVAADLAELAKIAPPEKSESMLALVRLVQTLAET